jgi:hypothetical protein
MTSNFVVWAVIDTSVANSFPEVLKFLLVASTLLYNNIKGKGHPITGHEGSKGGLEVGIALLILDFGARRGWVVSTMPRPL